jgi:hypothetical protein
VSQNFIISQHPPPPLAAGGGGQDAWRAHGHEAFMRHGFNEGFLLHKPFGVPFETQFTASMLLMAALLGSSALLAACGAIITPLALAGTLDASDSRVVKRLLLQLLDEDGDPSSGIRLTPAAFNTALSATNIAAAAFNPATSDLEKSSMSGVAELGASHAGVVAMKKTVLLDLNAAGWLAEKAEGLTLVDDSTLALTNDSDFGMKAGIFDGTGAPVSGADSKAVGCTAGNSARAARGTAAERATRLWLVRFDKKLSAFSMP